MGSMHKCGSVPAFELLFVSGMQGSGKTTLAHTVGGAYSIFDMGPALKGIHAAREFVGTFEDWMGVEVCKDPLFVPRAIGRLLADSADVDPRPPCVVGARSPGVISAIAELYNGNPVGIAYVDASYEVREGRYNSRTGYQQTMTFPVAEAYNIGLGTPDIRGISHCQIDNSGAFEVAASALSQFALCR